MNGSNMDGTDAPKKPDPSRKPSFKKPTRRCIYIIVAVLIFCIVVCILLAVLLRPKSKDDCPKGTNCNWRSMPHSEFLKDERCDSLCTTRPCIRSAQYVLGRIDASKDPCEDFYEFACGTYEQQAIIFPDQNEGVYTSQEMENEMLLNLKEIIDSVDESPGKSSLALRLVKMLYDDCMETDHHPDVSNKVMWKELFAENGRLPWPLLNENSRNDQKHLVRMMATTLFYDVNPFFELSDIRMEQMNRKDFLFIRFAQVEKPWAPITFQVMYKNLKVDDEARYAFTLAKILTEVGVDSSDLERILVNIIEVEKHFFQLATEAFEENEKVYVNSRHLINEYRNESCQNLDHDMGHMKWCELVKQLRKDYGFPADTPVRIELPSLRNYFVAVNTVLGHYLDRDVINFIGVKFVGGFMKYTPSPLREIYYSEDDFFPKSTSLPLTARWQQCVETVTQYMSLPLEKEYLRVKLDEKAREKIRNMVTKIKETHFSVLDKMSWMKTILGGTDPKKLVREMKLLIATSDELMKIDEAAIDTFYSLGFADGEGKAKNVPLLLDILQMQEFYTKVSVVADVEDYDTIGSKFFYEFQSRDAVEGLHIPYKQLAFPMYLPGRPMYVEYANLGSAISHYIMFLLSVGAQKGNSTRQALQGTLNCLSEQSHLYKTGNMNYKGDSLDSPRNVIKTVSLMLHTLSIHASFQSYEDYLKENGEEKGLPGLPFSNEQLFFISVAQAHCEKLTEKGYAALDQKEMYPARFRVNIPLAHLKEFSEAFRCPADSSMNLNRRCCVLGDGKLSRDCK